LRWYRRGLKPGTPQSITIPNNIFLFGPWKNSGDGPTDDNSDLLSPGF
jgi:hypothetical protein